MLINSKRLAKKKKKKKKKKKSQLLIISTQLLNMYVAVLLVFDRISYRPGEGRMSFRLN